jgi:II/X family phage/plasmid replication protein
MLIDWMTARIEYNHFEPEIWKKLQLMNDRIIRFKPKDSVQDDVYFLIDHESIEWNTTAWDSIRSDSHQVAFKIGSDALWIQGSPARVIGRGCAVFGSGASKSLDLSGCLNRMIVFVEQKLDVSISNDMSSWKVSRVDVTENILLDSLADVRLALSILRDCEGGRYRVSQQAGDTVYWSHRSRLKKGKAYAKGPQLIHQMKNSKYWGYQYNHYELEKADRILRLELTLGSQFFRELKQRKSISHWTELNSKYLRQEWKDYFYRMIGDIEMTNDKEIRDRIIMSAKTEGQGKSAYVMYLLIRNEGWQSARENTTRSLWYRNLKTLKLAGLGDADIAKGNVVQFRRKILSFNVVESFAQCA